ncbi:hypothetical protein [Vibrio europaeus]|uniref:hypothetical protein n=1 Tax=Vibrio europaeus TaxID=300876 RepID=UPI00233F4B22|nr:hypothetical protein [Vibrio europaeus]MDC5855548.1 hypothetical protein [Vibrio europaeus]
MKKLFFLLSFLFASSAYCERFEYSGEILEIVSSQSNSFSSIATLYVNGFKTAGTCYVADSTSLVALLIKDNEQGKVHLSMALSAYMAGKKIRVRVDDSLKGASNVCYLEQIRLNDSL